MNDKKQDLQKDEALKTVTGAQGQSSWKKLLAKKWVFPAVYMAAAAIILTLMWVYQDAATNKSAATEPKGGLEVSSNDTGAKGGQTAVPVNAAAETMQWPVKDKNAVTTGMQFYDASATNEVKAAATVHYNQQFTPHTGLDFTAKDNQPFDVVAALSGKVTAVENNPVVGHLVEVTSDNGLVTVYQSLADVKVTKGADVKKGDVIAKAGRNELEKDEGVHLHFEVRQDGNSVNPQQFLNDK
ncbi:peptidoglycan DD-metalloendopeptidase family protein [Paenibacillus chartarius]|uniref:Peptidoglycan DD-metalloendopeptidase family protein n=1 Tax=Paenibacillus chartarius TaxID=747481 RepID=A0ABV6DUR7_9BACL